MKINYVCIWGRKKEKSWSGTNYSLFKSLSKIIDVKDLGFRISIFEKILIKIFSLYRINGKLKFCSSLSPFAANILNLHSAFKTKFDATPQLQIGDIAKSRSPYYVYQDLSIDSLIYIKENDIKAFDFSPYRDFPQKILNKRNEWQKKIYMDARGIFTMSKWLADNLIDNSGLDKKKVHHVGGGINIDPNKIEKTVHYNNKILFVGRDFKRKAGYQVVDAFKILRNKYMNSAELYIVGPSEYPLDQKSDNVKFLGDISPDELSKYFNICDVFCMPSYFEAYGLVFIEALVYGLPCIGRKKFEMKEFIQDGYNGYLIDNDSPEELAIKMYDLLTNEIIKNNVRLNRDAYIEKYSWDAVAKRMVGIMERDKKDQ